MNLAISSSIELTTALVLINFWYNGLFSSVLTAMSIFLKHQISYNTSTQSAICLSTGIPLTYCKYSLEDIVDVDAFYQYTKESN